MENFAEPNFAELWDWIESCGVLTKTARLPAAAQLPTTAQRASQFAALCTALGAPQQKFCSVHVAGSKGKGQTASYIAYGLAALGLRVGLFSSPHIYSYRDRFQVLQSRDLVVVPSNGANILALGEFFPSCPPQIAALDISEILLQQGGQLRRDLDLFCRPTALEKFCSYPNFFAVLTLLAFRSFAAAACDWVVLETGIGGRLCPTNVVLPELSVITPIELEHTDLLGASLELIATEKAGIIKPGRPCVVARQYPQVTAVLHSRCPQDLYLLQNCLQNITATEKPDTGKKNTELPMLPMELTGSPLLRAFCRHRHVRFDMLLAAGDKYRRSELELRAYSSTQLDNISLALLALQVLEQKKLLPTSARCKQKFNGQKSSGENKKNAWQLMLHGLQQSHLPGRFASYCLPNSCLLLFDGAHTPVSCARLWQDLQSYLNYEETGGKNLKLGLLFAAVKGKNFAAMARILAPNFDEILLTRAGTFKQNDLPALELAFGDALRQKLPRAKTTDERPQKTPHLLPSVPEPMLALRTLLRNGPDLLLVCGSFYLLGELLPNISNIVSFSDVQN